MNFGFLNFLFGDAGSASASAEVPLTVINPSTSLPMMEDNMGGVDVGGSPYGMDVHGDMGASDTGSMDSNPFD